MGGVGRAVVGGAVVGGGRGGVGRVTTGAGGTVRTVVGGAGAAVVVEALVEAPSGVIAVTAVAVPAPAPTPVPAPAPAGAGGMVDVGSADEAAGTAAATAAAGPGPAAVTTVATGGPHGDSAPDRLARIESGRRAVPPAPAVERSVAATRAGARWRSDSIGTTAKLAQRATMTTRRRRPRGTCERSVSPFARGQARRDTHTIPKGSDPRGETLPG